MTLKQKLARSLLNIPGWRTPRKILVIESDDWGSIRMPSRKVYEKCLKNGYPVDKNPYERYDSLASQEDLEHLFELLWKFKDKNGNPAVFTANCVVANPDFEKIEEDKFGTYHFELITETFKKYERHNNNFEIWKEGIKNCIFHPQFHAREHLNVSKFMNALQEGDKDVLFGFRNGMPGNLRKDEHSPGNLFVEATRYSSPADKKDKLDIYLSGLKIFKNLFTYSSESIIPPNYTWSPDYNAEVAKAGVKYIQGQRKFKVPDMSFGPVYKNNRFIGKPEGHGILSLVRNVMFEPSYKPETDGVDRALKEMEIAFRFRKPAIITSHRLNYVGFIDVNNRDRNLRNLELLLSSAVKKWPDIEFMSSDTLGEIISKDVLHH